MLVSFAALICLSGLRPADSGGATAAAASSGLSAVPETAASSAAATASAVSGGNTVKDNLALCVSFPDGSAGSAGTWQLSNSDSNDVIMQAKIYIDDSLIATSPAVKPGKNVKSITLQNDLKEGSYDAIAYINYYDVDTQVYRGSAGYRVNVTVK
jgi:hypothetical protein